MKLHISETEEASPNQGEAEDYGYRFTCPRPLRHTTPISHVWGYPTAIKILPGSWSRTNHVLALAPQSAGSGARARLWEQIFPKAGFYQRCQGDRMVGVTGIEPVTPTMST
ncbi:hypothetical protein RL4094 [Rhizobium johnstonii 3841]|uniref:Uncharacterized protein n=1 Tax=Rhizobium johnstonii (strain DSM 114642 / LMG 32736 / 3841) TaxID=216596 RepID=Q1MBV0_RHIJ3|nr:hypothetical protein RL4094 [Rhizobium johnstonii 3841]